MAVAESTTDSPPRRGAGLFAWLACGCLIALMLLGVAVAVGAGIAWFAITGFASSVARDAVSPAAHRERALATLRPRDGLPAGYQPIAGLRIPFVLRGAALASGTDSLIVYLDGASYLDPGETASPQEWLDGIAAWTRSGVRVDLGAELAAADFALDELLVEHRAYRGELEVGGSSRSGVIGVLRLECPEDERFRVVLWAAPESPGGGLDSTPADSAAATALLGHFQLCP